MKISPLDTLSWSVGWYNTIKYHYSSLGNIHIYSWLSVVSDALPRVLLYIVIQFSSKNIIEMNVSNFFCRCFAQINPTGGTKIAKKRGKKQRTGVHPKVLSLVNELSLFEWTQWIDTSNKNVIQEDRYK